MYIVTVVFHVLVCIVLMGVVLLQAGRGAEVGAAFGGSSQTIFGSRGAATFLSKLTIGAAFFYMLTSLTLSVLTKQRSVVDLPTTNTPPAVSETPTPAPAMPAPATSAPAINPTSSETEKAPMAVPPMTPPVSMQPTTTPEKAQ